LANNKEKPTLDLLKDLKAVLTNPSYDKLSRVYTIYGEELFVRERVSQRLKQIMEKLNGTVDRVTFEKIDMPEWINNLYDMPMFTTSRLVIASELSDLKDAQIEQLIEYLKKPSPEVVLLLLTEKIDKRKKKLASVLDYGTVCNAKHPRENDLPMWIKGFAGERGKTIEFDAVEFLKNKFEGNLSVIEKEIEKTTLYIGTQEMIRKNDIEFMATGISSGSVFDIFPYLADKNKKQLLQTVYKLMESGEKPLMILSIITGRVKKLLNGHDLMAENTSDAEMAKETGVHPFYLNDFKREVKSYKKEELTNMYKRCMNIDSELKSSKRQDVDVLISGILRLAEHR
jgi:DNA polymerase III subunit delta